MTLFELVDHRPDSDYLTRASIVSDSLTGLWFYLFIFIPSVSRIPRDLDLFIYLYIYLHNKLYLESEMIDRSTPVWQLLKVKDGLSCLSHDSSVFQMFAVC